MVMKTTPISWVWRLYVYAIHGYVAEVAFTATWEFVVHNNLKFPGQTSLWSLIIYGLSVLAIERMYLKMKDKVPLVLRAVIYTAWSYAWEFSCGYLLRKIDACPWDYSEYHGDFMGLVTLEYLPLWYAGVLFAERVVIRCTRRLHWTTCDKRDLGVEVGREVKVE